MYRQSTGVLNTAYLEHSSNGNLSSLPSSCPLTGFTAQRLIEGRLPIVTTSKFSFHLPKSKRKSELPLMCGRCLRDDPSVEIERITIRP